MGGRGATASFNGMKASSYTKTFSKQLELSELLAPRPPIFISPF